MELFADERARGLDDIRLKIYLDIIECIQDPQSRAGNHIEPKISILKQDSICLTASLTHFIGPPVPSQQLGMVTYILFPI